MDKYQAGKFIRQHARVAAYFCGAGLAYSDIARWCPADWSPRFICEQAELAGFPVWASAPEAALKPLAHLTNDRCRCCGQRTASDDRAFDNGWLCGWCNPGGSDCLEAVG